MSEYLNENFKNHKNDEFVHFLKINIFGDSGVGKSTLISYMDNYDKSDYDIKNDNNEEFNNSEISFEISSPLVEEVKNCVIDFNDDRNLYFNIYKSNLKSYDSIKLNLDTILLQTECIIIMWDNSNPETFDNIPNFIKTIEEGINNYKFRNVPIFVIQNKMDLNLDKSAISIEEDEFKKTIDNLKEKHPNIIYKTISLLDKSEFYELIDEMYKKMRILEKDLKKDENNDWPLNNVKLKYPKLDLNENENINNLYNIKCLLLGNSAVGKTTFIKNIIGKSDKQIIPKDGIEHYSIFAEVFNYKICFDLIDSVVKKKYKGSEPKVCYKYAVGILLIFDVTNKESFNEINDWITSIKEIKGKINGKYELFLIGNKIDDYDKREVSKQAAKDFAEKHKIKYFECSFLKKINLFEILNEILLMTYKKYKKYWEDTKSFKIKPKKKIKKKNCC